MSLNQANWKSWRKWFDRNFEYSEYSSELRQSAIPPGPTYYALRLDVIQIVTKSVYQDEVNRGSRYRNALQLACEKGVSEVVQKLLDAGADMERHDEDGRSPLHIAAMSGSLEVVQLLLNRGANSEAMDKYGRTPFALAADNGRDTTSKWLFNHGVHLDVANVDCCGQLTVHNAASGGSVETLGLLLNEAREQGFEHINVVDKNGRTPLAKAVTKGRNHAVRYLLSQSADLSIADTSGCLPIHRAAERSSETLKLLLDARADLHCTDNAGNTPICSAARYGNLDALKQLQVQGADMGITNRQGDSLLHIAASCDSSKVMRYLMAEGVGLEKKNALGQTPLHAALWSFDSDPAQLFLEYLDEPVDSHDGADSVDTGLQAIVSAADNEGSTPLHLAAARKESWFKTNRVFDLLLSLKANVNTLNGDGLTPLHIAARCGSCHAVSSLVNHGADMAAVDKTGATPLHAAAANWNDIVVELLLVKGADLATVDKTGSTILHLAAARWTDTLVKLLLAKGANVTANDHRGLTPLHLAAFGNNISNAEALIQHEADVDASSLQGTTPLHLAAGAGNVDTLLLLASNGADIFARDQKGWMPLHYAARRKRKKYVLFFLERGNAIDATTQNGLTPLHLACQYNRYETVKSLMDHGADVSIRDQCHRIALHHAASRNHAECIAVLSEKKSKFSNTEVQPPSLTNAIDVLGHTPLFVAAEFGCIDAVRELLTIDDNHVTTRSTSGLTALDAADRQGHFGIVKLLLDAYSQLGTSSEEFDHSSISRDGDIGNPELVQLLSKLPSDMNGRHRGQEVTDDRPAPDSEQFCGRFCDVCALAIHDKIKESYHCSICFDGDFDMCAACYEHGDICFSGHTLKYVPPNTLVYTEQQVTDLSYLKSIWKR